MSNQYPQSQANPDGTSPEERRANASAALDGLNKAEDMSEAESEAMLVTSFGFNGKQIDAMRIATSAYKAKGMSDKKAATQALIDALPPKLKNGPLGQAMQSALRKIGDEDDKTETLPEGVIELNMEDMGSLKSMLEEKFPGMTFEKARDEPQPAGEDDVANLWAGWRSLRIGDVVTVRKGMEEGRYPQPGQEVVVSDVFAVTRSDNRRIDFSYLYRMACNDPECDGNFHLIEMTGDSRRWTLVRRDAD